MEACTDVANIVKLHGGGFYGSRAERHSSREEGLLGR